MELVHGTNTSSLNLNFKKEVGTYESIFFKIN